MSNGKMKVLGIWLGMVGLWYGLITCGAGCHPSGLSRSEAEKLIRSDTQFASDASDLWLSVKDKTGAAGARAGLWTIEGAGDILFFHLTPKGERYFIASDQQSAKLIDGWRRKLTLVTGIAEAGEGNKEVEFLWEAENVPKEVAELLALGPWKARALLRRFDDGWRVRGLDLNGRGFVERR
jgi:hypothetical protein